MQWFWVTLKLIRVQFHSLYIYTLKTWKAETSKYKTIRRRIFIKHKVPFSTLYFANRYKSSFCASLMQRTFTNSFPRPRALCMRNLVLQRKQCAFSVSMTIPGEAALTKRTGMDHSTLSSADSPLLNHQCQVCHYNSSRKNWSLVYLALSWRHFT